MLKQAAGQRSEDGIQFPGKRIPRWGRPGGDDA